ncbi:MAG: hypothetical protein C4519_23510 [Desulfobacteraceae bacterium]|nr:MAG: hypothetical protein C4519_23510 [Desulfobacteraceae bacterium]
MCSPKRKNKPASINARHTPALFSDRGAAFHPLYRSNRPWHQSAAGQTGAPRSESLNFNKENRTYSGAWMGCLHLIQAFAGMFMIGDVHDKGFLNRRKTDKTQLIA